MVSVRDAPRFQFARLAEQFGTLRSVVNARSGNDNIQRPAGHYVRATATIDGTAKLYENPVVNRRSARNYRTMQPRQNKFPKSDAFPVFGLPASAMTCAVPDLPK